MIPIRHTLPMHRKPVVNRMLVFLNIAAFIVQIFMGPNAERLIDTVVRAVVTDEFTLGATVRAWLDEDEFLIRRRIHRDMAALLRERDTE